MVERKRLSDILMNSERESLERAWSTTKAADDLTPLPSGEYRCRIASGELSKSKGGTPGYKLKMEVADGEHVGRLVWHDIWLTDAAMSMAKRDLAKLGIERFEQLDQPLPPGIIVSARIALRKNDDGSEYNRVSRFEVVGIEPPDPFAPADGNDGEEDTTDADGFDWRAGAPSNGVPTT
jgi:hypothetical protein